MFFIFKNITNNFKLISKTTKRLKTDKTNHRLTTGDIKQRGRKIRGLTKGTVDQRRSKAKRAGP